MNRCGDCIHARIVPGNLQQRVCRGGPPQPVPIAHPGGITIQHMFPVVLAADEGCGQFKYKNVIDHINGEVVQ